MSTELNSTAAQTAGKPAAAPKKPKAKKIAVVDMDKCLFCNVCANKCKFDALETFVDEWILDGDKCIGCGMCARACVAGAITMIARAQQ